jgi:hypothetical protein
MGRDGSRNRLEGKYNSKTYKKDNVIIQMKKEDYKIESSIEELIDR